MAEMTEKEMAELMGELDTPVTPTRHAPIESEPVVEVAVVADPVPAEADYEVAKPPVVEKVKVGNETMLNRFINPDQVRIDVSINPATLDDEMMNHASLYIHYATQTVNARRQFDRLKSAFEILEARLDGEIRTEALASGKKVTEGSIKSAMVADKRWSGAQSKVIESGSIYRLCEAVESAMSQRKDMILEVARDRRKEKEGQLRVLESQDMRDRVLSMIAEKKVA